MSKRVVDCPLGVYQRPCLKASAELSHSKLNPREGGSPISEFSKKPERELHNTIRPLFSWLSHSLYKHLKGDEAIFDINAHMQLNVLGQIGYKTS